MKDFADGNKVIIQMFKGTDHSYNFVPKMWDGSVFVWPSYTVTAEGRLASASTTVVPDFVFPVTYNVVDSVSIGNISFPASMITEQVREDKIFWRINATNIATGLTKVILYGEIWLEVF